MRKGLKPFLLCMAERIVKCVVTGEKGPSSSFYKAPNKKWYRDEKTYQNWCAESNARKKVIEWFFTEVLGYSLGEGVIFPTLLVKRIKEYEKSYGYQTLLRCCQESSAEILRAVRNKKFSNDNGKIAYVFAIINSRINETKRKEKQAQLITRPSEVPEEVHDLQTKHKERDIRRWLDDDDD